MKYFVAVNKKYQYIKVYSILKKVNESTDPLSRAAAAFVDRFILKKKKGQ
jgi:hypothetical protein